MRFRFSLVAASAVIVSLAAPRPSDATEVGPRPPRARKPPVLTALVSGLATAIVPMALGTARTATATTVAGKNLGLELAGVGTALAPIVSHVVLGEWQRAAAFGAAPVAGEIGLVAWMQTHPTATFHGSDADLGVFATFFLLNLLGSVVGMTDVAVAGERQGPSISLAPVALGGRYMMTIGGRL